MSQNIDDREDDIEGGGAGWFWEGECPKVPLEQFVIISQLLCLYNKFLIIVMIKDI